MLRREGYQELRSTSAPDTEIGSLSDVLGAAVTEALLVEEGAAAAGRLIGEIEVRKRTGATVVAVSRGGETEINPGAAFRLQPGDTVVLIGSPEQIDSAVDLIAGSETRASVATTPTT